MESATPTKVAGSKLYLRLPSENSPQYRKTKAILNMFPGMNQTVLYFVDTKVRRGTMCMFDSDMLLELERLLGESSVVLK